jgi:chemotaxis protein methyltransferase CheR
MDTIEDLQIGLLLRGVRQAWGHDFSGYAEASLKRRVRHWLAESPFQSIAQAQAAVLGDAQVFASLLQGITINVTEMFRDPPMFRALREQVIPALKTFPFLKIWHAGCASGEEAYSMAILLHEAGLQGRYRMYATDINEAVLARARAGVYPLKSMQASTRNYHASGGLASFADYYSARYGHAALSPGLREHLVFGQHNLVTDTDLGEMQLILCRNVMIYFKPGLKERCMALFDGGLAPGGFLCLGGKEALDSRTLAGRYARFATGPGIYRKHAGVLSDPGGSG